MIRFSLFLLLFVFLSQPIFGQDTAQMNNWLKFKMQRAKLDQTLDEVIPLFVQGDLANIEREVKKLGGDYLYGIKTFGRINLAVDQIASFAQTKGLVRIEYEERKIESLGQDYLRENNNLDSVHMGLGLIPFPAKGDSVIVGIIDEGIDYRHYDLQNADSSSRILYLWDQVIEDSTNMGSSYGYGYEWTKEDIDNETCQHNPNVGTGHGTLTAGVACGNGQWDGAYQGAAPNSKIVFVNMGNYSSSFIDGIFYIFQRATAEGLPCVINSSVGSYAGTHDDRPITVQLVETLIDAQPGRAVVQAAGNGANPIFSNGSCNRWHLGYEVTTDTVFTFFRYTNVYNQVVYEMHADEEDFDNVYFSFRPRNRTTFEVGDFTKFYNVQTDFDFGGGTDAVLLDTIYKNGSAYSYLRIDVEKNQGVYDFLIQITGSVGADYYEMHTTGSGNFDVWSSRQFFGTSKISSCVLPTIAQVPEMAKYKMPDTLKTIVSGINCSDKVISVANYSNTDGYDHWGGGFVSNSTPRGYKVLDSSYGPTRDNRVKPDIGASGNFTWSVSVLEILESLKVNAPENVTPEGHHSRFAGTSCSAPIVAGTIACYLQVFPEAEVEDIKQALLSSARVDDLVLLEGAVPNNGFGYGKLDGFNFLNGSIIYGCQDPLAFNFNPMANFSDGSCVYEGCTDTLATNFDPNASIDDGSCDYLNATENLLAEGISIDVQPNPFHGQTVIHYKNETGVEMEIVIFDMLGKKNRSITLSNLEGSIIFDAEGMSAGVYLLSIKAENQFLKTKRLIVY